MWILWEFFLFYIVAILKSKSKTKMFFNWFPKNWLACHNRSWLVVIKLFALFLRKFIIQKFTFCGYFGIFFQVWHRIWHARFVYEISFKCHNQLDLLSQYWNCATPPLIKTIFKVKYRRDPCCQYFCVGHTLITSNICFGLKVLNFIFKIQVSISRLIFRFL